MKEKTIENALYNAKRKRNGISKWVIEENGQELIITAYKDGRIEVE